MLGYRAVGNRCAVDFSLLHLPILPEEALALLVRKGFSVVEVDVVEIARACIGVSRYRRGARLEEAPGIFDCSSFMKWLYGQRGIWIPRRSIQQRECGVSIELDRVQAGDLIFVSGAIDYYWDDPADGVGHVGLVTGEGTIVHAANSKVHIVETPFEQFAGPREYRGARRILPSENQSVITLITPLGRGVECSDDIRWIVLQNLS